jgi:hypothetical protein
MSLRVLQATVLFLALGACGKPVAKFHPGDKVRVKLAQTEGVVVLRTRLFQEDQYRLKVAGDSSVFLPAATRFRVAAWDAYWDAYWEAKYGHIHVPYVPNPWHDEGPFYESDLELVP